MVVAREQVWAVSDRAVKQMKAGYAPIAGRKLPTEYKVGFSPRGGPVGWLPILPVRARCRCGYVQWLDAARLEVQNPSWEDVPWMTNRGQRSGTGPANRGRRGGADPEPGDRYELDSELDLRRWDTYRQSIS